MILFVVAIVIRVARQTELLCPIFSSVRNSVTKFLRRETNLSANDAPTQWRDRIGMQFANSKECYITAAVKILR